MTANLLRNETSPYLLQHKDNPVHWMPWGPEALRLARDTNRPILLSIGYAACHWCHVMAHESFEDPEIAALMNERFVNIKVDREERPDIDKIYMEALQRMGEQGGWPLTMFLTPDGEPFWGGTYFPPAPRHGQPGFPTVLREISRIYHAEPDKIRSNAAAIRHAMAKRHDPDAPRPDLSIALIDRVAEHLLGAVDMARGGLKGAPKFPQVPLFMLLWRAYLRSRDETYRRAVEALLVNMGQGGIYDHLGGGFARYSVDDRWLVPHFEKMLYDNAMLVELMTLTWQEIREPLLRTRIEETVAWVLREMTADSGAFAASLDADSEGEEGRFYVWSEAEIRDTLPPDLAELFCVFYDVRPGGNWEGRTILNRLQHRDLADADTEAQLAQAREHLLRVRDKRVRAGWDDKVLADWNGLMISALSFAGIVFGRPDWVAAARRAFEVVNAEMIRRGHLHHALRRGRAQHLAVLDDYANLIRAALSLHEATGEPDFIARATDLAEQANRYYWDDEQAGYFYTSSRAETLIVRQKSALDDATPNGNATMLGNLARLWLATGNAEHRTRAERMMEAFSPAVGRNVYAHAGFLNAVEDYLDLVQAIIVAPSPSAAAALRIGVFEQSLPTRMVFITADTSRLADHHPAHGKEMVDGQPTLYLCRGTTCSAPITEPGRLSGLPPGSAKREDARTGRASTPRPGTA
ncbi:thioredoxin domain-containing protein [Rhodoligotrophos defluvii]|uniref:thioredoxin domain-containing protein n=1 Tax=Rhodoligotrophos defluvii TaxID=2561934 RepID=UPI0010C96E8B|nr:thioredoxin domain-containing protein [Rhodoligotrophos defluvii]